MQKKKRTRKEKKKKREREREREKERERKKRQRSQRSNCQHPLDHGKSKRVPEKNVFLLYWLFQSL